MHVFDAGHKYGLQVLDGNGVELLTFVKREGGGYPGNIGHYSGTNIQDVLRACIDRIKYLDAQISSKENDHVLDYLRASIFCLERRAAERHNRKLELSDWEMEVIETIPTCKTCGHIGCLGH